MEDARGRECASRHCLQWTDKEVLHVYPERGEKLREYRKKERNCLDYVDRVQALCTEYTD